MLIWHFWRWFLILCGWWYKLLYWHYCGLAFEIPPTLATSTVWLKSPRVNYRHTPCVFVSFMEESLAWWKPWEIWPCVLRWSMYCQKRLFLQILLFDQFWLEILPWMTEVRRGFGLRFVLWPLLHTAPVTIVCGLIRLELPTKKIQFMHFDDVFRAPATRSTQHDLITLLGRTWKWLWTPPPPKGIVLLLFLIMRSNYIYHWIIRDNIKDNTQDIIKDNYKGNFSDNFKDNIKDSIKAT